jgi:hypothetical protein
MHTPAGAAGAAPVEEVELLRRRRRGQPLQYYWRRGRVAPVEEVELFHRRRRGHPMQYYRGRHCSCCFDRQNAVDDATARVLEFIDILYMYIYLAGVDALEVVAPSWSN